MINIYKTFEEEKAGEREKSLGGWGRSGDFDSGIRSFLENFNQLPFVYSNGMSCSGLRRDHTIWQPPGWNLETDYVFLKHGQPFTFHFAYDSLNPAGKDFLDKIKEANNNAFSEVTLEKEVHPQYWYVDVHHYRRLYEGACDFRYEVFITRKNEYIPGKEFDLLRDQQIRKLYELILHLTI